MDAADVVCLSNIPLELKELNQWCLWQYEMHNNKQTKVPYQPNGKHAKVNDVGTYSSYNAVFESIGKYSGVGFIFTADDPYCFIDLDNCFRSEQARLIYEKFRLTYCEYSPSGNGLHIICRAKVPYGKRSALSDGTRIEIYSSNRYATMTGKIYVPQNI